MRNRLILVLFVALLGIPAMPAAADDGTPTPSDSPVPTEQATPTPSPSEPTTAPSDVPSSRTPTAEKPRERAPQERANQTTNIEISTHTAGTTGAHHNANVWGKAGNEAGVIVRTEVLLTDGSWSQSQVARTQANGNYVIPLTYGKGLGGTQTFRVVLGADRRAESEPFNLTRVAVIAESAGSRVVGVTSNVWGTAVGAPNAEVWTEVRLPNGVWSRSQTGRTSDSGYYQLPLTYGFNTPGTWNFRVATMTNVGPIYAYVNLTRVSVSATTAGTRQVGAATNVWGTAAGAPNSEVWTEVRLSNGTWSRSQAGRTSASGYYALPLTYGRDRAGTYTYRVGVRASGSAIYSSPVTITWAGTKLDSRCLSGRVMCASKKDRKMWWVIDGKIQKTFDARFGCPGTPSDNGSFRVFWKSYNHTSTIYGTWMPRAMFYNGGEAVHFSQDFQARGWAGCSGGCINIRDWNGINDLYNEVRNGDKVVVY